MKTWAILAAAGSGSRMGSEGGSVPKAYLPLNGLPILVWSVRKLLAVAAVERVVVVEPPHLDDSPGRECFGDGERVELIRGGAQRSESVLNGLLHLDGRADAGDWVLVHDAARPCVSLTDIHRLLEALADDPVGGLLARPVDDTLKREDDAGRVVATLERSGLWQALTPQMFRHGLLLEAMQRSRSEGVLPGDEAAAVERLGHRPKLVEGSRLNLKITRRDDLELAGRILDMESV